MVAGAAGTALALTPAEAATSSNPVTSRLAHLKSALSGLVTDGTLTQAQADKVATTLDQQLPKRGPQGQGLRGPDGQGMGGRLFGRDLRGPLARAETAAATALHLTTDELGTQLRAGKSLAQIAATQKVSVDTLVTAVVDAEKAELAAQVKAGRLTQSQADSIGGTLTQRVTDLVNGVGPGRGPGSFGPGSFGPGGFGPGGFGHWGPARQAPGQTPGGGATSSSTPPAA
jgi:hypothetical protein